MEGTAAKGNDWSTGSTQSPVFTTKFPGTERVEKLLLQYKVHLKTTQTTSRYATPEEPEVPQLNQHVVCELELWNVVNDELSSLNYKPITFTADHASPSSDQLVIGLTSSSIARHTVSDLIAEIMRKEDKIKLLKRRMSRMSAPDWDKVHAQSTPRQSYAQSTPLAQSHPQPLAEQDRLSVIARLEEENERLQDELAARPQAEEEDHLSVITWLEEENEKLQAELAARPDMHDFKATQNKVKDLLLSLKEKEIQLLDFKSANKKVEELTKQLQQIKRSLQSSDRVHNPLVPPSKLDKSTDSKFKPQDHLSIITMLEQENERLQAELAARPEMQELKTAQKEVKDMLLQLQERESRLRDLEASKRKDEELTARLKHKEELERSVKLNKPQAEHGHLSVITRLEEENERLQAELGARPDVQAYQKKVKELLLALQQREAQLQDFRECKKKLEELTKQLQQQKQLLLSYSREPKPLGPKLDKSNELNKPQVVQNNLAVVTRLEQENERLQAELAARCDMQELTSAQNKVEELRLALQLKETELLDLNASKRKIDELTKELQQKEYDLLLSSYKARKPFTTPLKLSTTRSDELMTGEQEQLFAITWLEQENERLLAELATRPDMHEFRATQKKVQELILTLKEKQTQLVTFKVTTKRKSEELTRQLQQKDYQLLLSSYKDPKQFMAPLMKPQGEQIHSSTLTLLEQENKSLQTELAARPDKNIQNKVKELLRRLQEKETQLRDLEASKRKIEELARQLQQKVLHLSSHKKENPLTTPLKSSSSEDSSSEDSSSEDLVMPQVELEHLSDIARLQEENKRLKAELAARPDEHASRKVKELIQTLQKREAQLVDFKTSKMKVEELSKQLQQKEYELLLSSYKETKPFTAPLKLKLSSSDELMKEDSDHLSVIARLEEENERLQDELAARPQAEEEDHLSVIARLEEANDRLQDELAARPQAEEEDHLCVEDHLSVIAWLEEENERLQAELASRPDMNELKSKMKELLMRLQEKEIQLKTCKRKVEDLTKLLQQQQRRVFSYEDPRPSAAPLKLSRSRSQVLMKGDRDHADYAARARLVDSEARKRRSEDLALQAFQKIEKPTSSMPPSQSLNRSHKLIKDVQRLLSVSDEEQVVMKLKDVMATLDSHLKLEKRFSTLLHLVYHDCVPISCPDRSFESVTRGGGGPPTHHDVWCEVTWQHVVRILRTWVFHIKGIQELQWVIGDVCEYMELRPMPDNYHDNQSKEANCVTFTCQELAVLLRRWLLDESNLKVGSQQLVFAMIQHFQELFNVARLEGVYPAMSILSQQNQHHKTVLTRLKDCLKLDGTTSGNQMVSAVEYIMQKDNSDCLAKIHQMFGPIKSSELLEKMKLCNEFFPSFQRVIKEMQQILGVSALSGIIPALRELQKRSQTRG